MTTEEESPHLASFDFRKVEIKEETINIWKNSKKMNYTNLFFTEVKL